MRAAPATLTRYVLLIAGVLDVAALIVLSAAFGTDLDYRYEVSGISIAWLALILAGALLAVIFRDETLTNARAPSAESSG